MPGPGAYWIGKEEKQEVLELFESGHLSRYGEPDDPGYKRKVVLFEKEFAQYIGVGHAVATSSGTGSLFIALHAMGIRPGDEVIVPTFGFVATYSAAIFAGAVPVLAEIDETLTLDPADIVRQITPRTKAIIPVHMLGNPAAMDAIEDIARRHGLTILEDACQGMGASYRGRKVGSFGRMAAFSLNVFKTITAGDGGILVTDDAELWQRAFGLQDQGYRSHGTGLTIGDVSPLGMNFRMNELTGAVARAQLRKLDRITATLRQKKGRLKQLLGEPQGWKYRPLTDAEGECGTLCPVIFDSAPQAAAVAQRLGTCTLDQSGWHVYANMDHINRHLAAIGRPHGLGAYPQTDDLLRRSINISIGVVDPGLGSGFGIDINATEEQIEQAARAFREACAATRTVVSVRV
jgi:dTDP-4-amino-4,6-dideoxygalactose transaminase